MKKNFLITGGSGFLATYWTNFLIKKGHDVSLLLNKRKINQRGVKIFKINKHFSFDKLFKKETFDIIINTASLTNVELCEKKPNLAKEVHEKFVLKLSKSAKKYNIYLIHISTDHLFSGIKSFYSEVDKPKPLNNYAKSKLESEKIIKKNLKKYLIIRGNFFGWAPSYRKSFSDWIISSNKSKKKINVFDDVIFTPLYILDFIKISSILIGKEIYGTYNVCSSNKISKFNFAKLISKVFKLNLDYIIKSSISSSLLTVRPLDMSLSFSKIYKKLKLNKFNYSIQNQIKNLKLDQNMKFIKKIREM